MKHVHALKPHKAHLSIAQLVLLLVATFAVTVLGGLYGPPLASRLAANNPVLRAAPTGPSPVYYGSCREAHAAGVYSIPRRAPAYREEWTVAVTA